MKFLASQLSYLLEKEQSRQNLKALARYLAVLTGVTVIFAVTFHLLMLYEGREYSWVTGFYWTLTVMSTLGFGDITFESDVGRAFSMIVLIVGIIMLLIVLPFAFIRFFYAPWLEAEMQARAPRSVPGHVEDHLLICGWGALARDLGKRLALMNIPYYVIEPDPVRATELHVEGVPALCGDIDARATYEAARVDKSRMLVTYLDDPANTSVILSAREACTSVPIVSLAEDEESEDLLELAGASHVLPLKRSLGEQLAARVEVARNAVHLVGSFENLLIGEFPVCGTPYAGLTLADSRLRQETGVNVVGLWERGRLKHVHSTTVLDQLSVPVVVGTESQIAALDELLRSDSSKGNPTIVVGGGKVGLAAALTLSKKGVPVNLVEHDPAVAEKLEYLELVEVFIGEGADIDVLERAGLHQASSVVLSTNNDATNIYLSIYFRKLSPEMRIIARITHERNIESIHRAGADFVLGYESLGAESVVALVQGRDFVFLGGDAEFFMIPVPSSLAGKTLRSGGIGERTGLNIIGVKQGDAPIGSDPDVPFDRGDTLFAIGTANQWKAFKREFGD